MPPRSRSAFLARLLLTGLLPLLGLAGGGARAAELTVSAASSLTQALRDLAPAFEAAQPGTTVRLNFGASGGLLAQIRQGAPVDVFLSADADTMDQAERQGLLQPGSRRDVATNTLVVIVPAAARPVPATLADLAGPGVQRIAVGLPASVPVGRYTRSVLEAARLWETLEPRLVGAVHVRQALDYVARGEVDAGFVYATDAAVLPGRVRVAFTVSTPQRITYPAAQLRGAPQPAAAARFLEFLRSPAAQAVLARHGFGRP